MPVNMHRALSLRSLLLSASDFSGEFANLSTIVNARFSGSLNAFENPDELAKIVV
jgi:hypothetical protein